MSGNSDMVQGIPIDKGPCGIFTFPKYPETNEKPFKMECKVLNI